jgi:hypothetical protein
MRKFYLATAIVNIGILILFGQFIFPFIEKIGDTWVSHYIEVSKITDYALSFYILIFWWFAPLSILWIKNYSNHLLLFISISILWGLIILINSLTYNPEEILYDIFLFMTSSVIVSILIHYSQIIIGKKLLPTLYKRNAGESDKFK